MVFMLWVICIVKFYNWTYTGIFNKFASLDPREIFHQPESENINLRPLERNRPNTYKWSKMTFFA